MITDTKVQQNQKIQSPIEDSPQNASSKFAQYEVSIANLSKPLVLKCLWENAVGFSSNPGIPMVPALTPKLNIKDAERFIQECLHKKQRLYFDYFFFQLLRVDLTTGTLMTKDYDSIYGIGSAKKAVEKARKITDENNDLKNDLDELRVECPELSGLATELTDTE